MTAVRPTQALMPGVHVQFGRPWKITADTIVVLQTALGCDMVNALVRCFGAVDRLLTILDCMMLNQSTHGHDSVRGERNHNVLGLFAVGLIFEFREGLRQLRDLGVEDRLSTEGRERWVKLVESAELKNEDAILQIRNCLAFHLGNVDVVTRGMARLAQAGDPVTITSGDGLAKIEGRHDLGWAVVMAGIDIRPAGVPKGTPNSHRQLTDADVVAAIDEASDSHFTVVRHFEDVVVDIFRHAGADYEALSPIAEDEFRNGSQNV